jgi:hypothetical protein
VTGPRIALDMGGLDAPWLGAGLFRYVIDLVRAGADLCQCMHTIVPLPPCPLVAPVADMMCELFPEFLRGSSRIAGIRRCTGRAAGQRGAAPARLHGGGVVAAEPGAARGLVAPLFLQRPVRVPDLYEGFGYPALEAMAAGACPVVRGCSSMAEVVGPAGRARHSTAGPGRRQRCGTGRSRAARATAGPT